MNSGAESSSNDGGQVKKAAPAAATATSAEGGSQSNKANYYSGVVAQRALYGSYKRRVDGGRRMWSKSMPSRLSKVSANDSSNI